MDANCLKEMLTSVLETCSMNTEQVAQSQESLLQVLRELSEELNSLSSLPSLEKEKLISGYFEKATTLKKRLHAINSKMEKIQTRVDKIEKRSLKALD